MEDTLPTTERVSSPAVATTPLKDSNSSEMILLSEITKISEQPKLLQVIDKFFPSEASPSSEDDVPTEILHVRATMKMLELQDQMHEVERKILKLRLLKVAGQTFQPQFIEDRCKEIGNIVEHLRLIVQNADLVQRHLQQPSRVDFLPLNFHHHQVFKDATNIIRDLLEKGDEIVENLDWSYAFKDTSNIKQLLNNLRSKIMEYHSSAIELQLFHDCIVKYCALHAE